MYSIINVTMDSVCILFTFMILLYLRTSTDRNERLNQLFAWICVSNIGMMVGDIPSWICTGNAKPWYPAVMWLGALVLYLSGSLIIWVYTLYLHTYLGKKIQINQMTLKIVHIICIVNTFLIFSNLWNGIYYTIDSGNVYRRGEWYWLSQMVPIVVLLINAGVIIVHRRFLQKKEIFAFLGYLMLPIAGIILQMWLYGIATTYLSSSIALFIIFLCVQSEQRFLAEQQRRDLDKAQVMIMMSQIQPHFLYNSLLGIKQLCDTAPKQASEALEHFSYYLRGNLSSLSDVSLITFERELEHAKDYLYLEKMRFGKRVNISWEIKFTDFFIPPLTLQPMIENAIRHGITKKKEGGTLIIKSEKTESAIVVMIIDDGVGFDTSAVPDTVRPHIGIDNVRKRLFAQCRGSLEIESKPGEGTRVTIVLPKTEDVNL